MESSRLRAKKTMLKKHGKDWYKKFSKMGNEASRGKAGFYDPEVARRAANKRWGNV